jgi:hypothetical protein
LGFYEGNGLGKSSLLEPEPSQTKKNPNAFRIGRKLPNELQQLRFAEENFFVTAVAPGTFDVVRKLARVKTR